MKFIEQIYAYAKKNPSAFFNSITIAQAILESDGGTSELAKQANNLFGIKASAPWTGAVYDKRTREEIKGESIYVKDGFRKYLNWEHSVQDHAGFMESTEERKKIYAKAIHAKSAQEQAYALQGTYATDSRYGRKLMDIIKKYNLGQYDIKRSGSVVTMDSLAKELGLRLRTSYAKERPGQNGFGHFNKQIGGTMHTTGNPRAGANAQMHARLQANGWSASWHVQGDDKEVIISFPFTWSAWHASDGRGSGNMHTVAYEMCVNSDGDYNRAIENAAKFWAILFTLKRWNVDKNLYQHYDWDKKHRKNCPAEIRAGKNDITWQVFKNKIKGYMDRLGQTGATYNPQGLDASDIPPYTSPNLPFEEMKVNDRITIRSPFNWVDLANKQFMKSKRHDEIVGTQDEIVEVKPVEMSYSKRAYKLKQYNSWILEQDLVEPRAKWQEVTTEVKETSDSPSETDITSDVVEMLEGQFFLEGKLYQIVEVK